MNDHYTEVHVRVFVHNFQLMQTLWATLTNCHLQWPEKFMVTLMQDGLNEKSLFQSTEQAVQEGMNTYLLEKELELRKRYQVLMKMENNYSISISENINICK